MLLMASLCTYKLSLQYRQSLYSMASIVTLGLASLLLNVSIARGLWKHHREHRKMGSTQSRTQEAEMKICVVTFIMFLTSIVAFVVQVKVYAKFYGEGTMSTRSFV